MFGNIYILIFYLFYNQSVEVISKVFISLALYGLFLADARLSEFWDKLDDHVYRVRLVLKSIFQFIFPSSYEIYFNLDLRAEPSNFLLAYFCYATRLLFWFTRVEEPSEPCWLVSMPISTFGAKLELAGRFSLDGEQP